MKWLFRNRQHCLCRITSFFIILQLAGAQPILSQQIGTQPLPGTSPLTSIFNLIDSLNLPDSIGKIVQKNVNHGEKWIIHIRDSHANYEAQKNIIRVLETVSKGVLTDERGNRSDYLIAIEGASGESEAEWFRALPHQELKKSILDYFLRKGNISGAQVYQNLEDYPVSVVGVEDPELYLKNLNSFREVYSVQEKADESIAQMESALFQIRDTLYGKDLLDFSNERSKYHQGNSDIRDYIVYLSQCLEEAGIYFQDLEQLQNAIRAVQIEKIIDYSVVEEQRDKLLAQLKERCPNDDLALLFKSSLQLRLSQISSLEYYRLLFDLAHANGLSLKADAPFVKYLELIQLQNKMEAESLCEEIREAENLLAKALAKNDSVKKCEDLLIKLNLLKKLSRLELSRSEAEVWLKNKQNYTADVFLEFVNHQSQEQGKTVQNNFEPQNVDFLLNRAEAFYRYALERDKILAENTLKAMNQKGVDVAVLVTGGFHSFGFKKHLEECGISSIVINPVLTQEPDKNLYLSLMLNRKGNRLAPPVNLFFEKPLGREDQSVLALILYDAIMALTQINWSRYFRGVDYIELLKKLTKGMHLESQVNEVLDSSRVVYQAKEKRDKYVRVSYEGSTIYVVVTQESPTNQSVLYRELRKKSDFRGELSSGSAFAVVSEAVGLEAIEKQKQYDEQQALKKKRKLENKRREKVKKKRTNIAQVRAESKKKKEPKITVPFGKPIEVSKRSELAGLIQRKWSRELTKGKEKAIRKVIKSLKEKNLYFRYFFSGGIVFIYLIDSTGKPLFVRLGSSAEERNVSDFEDFIQKQTAYYEIVEPLLGENLTKIMITYPFEAISRLKTLARWITSTADITPVQIKSYLSLILMKDYSLRKNIYDRMLGDEVPHKAAIALVSQSDPYQSKQIYDFLRSGGMEPMPARSLAVQNNPVSRFRVYLNAVADGMSGEKALRNAVKASEEDLKPIQIEAENELKEIGKELILELIREDEVSSLEELVYLLAGVVWTEPEVVREFLEQIEITNIDEIIQEVDTEEMQAVPVEETETAVIEEDEREPSAMLFTVDTRLVDLTKLTRDYQSRVRQKIKEFLRNPDGPNYLQSKRIKNVRRIVIGNMRLYLRYLPEENAVVIVLFDNAGDIKRSEGRDGKIKESVTQYLSHAGSLNILEEFDENYSFYRLEQTDEGGLAVAEELFPEEELSSPSTDGFIQQGKASLEMFMTGIPQIRQNEITETVYEKIQASIQELPYSFIKKNGFSSRLRKLKEGGLKIYGFESMVSGEDDFVLGHYDPETNILYLAEDLLAYLGERGPPSLALEYLVHEFCCPKFGHYPSILKQQKYMPNHYPDRKARENQTEEDLYKGELGLALREFINLKLAGGDEAPSTELVREESFKESPPTVVEAEIVESFQDAYARFLKKELPRLAEMGVLDDKDRRGRSIAFSDSFSKDKNWLIRKITDNEDSAYMLMAKGEHFDALDPGLKEKLEEAPITGSTAKYYYAVFKEIPAELEAYLYQGIQAQKKPARLPRTQDPEVTSAAKAPETEDEWIHCSQGVLPNYFINGVQLHRMILGELGKAKESGKKSNRKTIGGKRITFRKKTLRGSVFWTVRKEHLRLIGEHYGFQLIEDAYLPVAEDEIPLVPELLKPELSNLTEALLLEIKGLKDPKSAKKSVSKLKIYDLEIEIYVRLFRGKREWVVSRSGLEKVHVKLKEEENRKKEYQQQLDAFRTRPLEEKEPGPRIIPVPEFATPDQILRLSGLGPLKKKYGLDPKLKDGKGSKTGSLKKVIKDILIEEELPEKEADRTAYTLSHLHKGSLEVLEILGVISKRERLLLALKNWSAFSQMKATDRNAFARRMEALLKFYDTSLTKEEKDKMLNHLIPCELIRHFGESLSLPQNVIVQMLDKHPDFIEWMPKAAKRAGEIALESGDIQAAWKQVIEKSTLEEMEKSQNQDSTFSQFSAFWEENYGAKPGRRNAAHALINSLSEVGKSFGGKVKIRLYPHSQNENGLVGVLLFEGKEILGVWYEKETGIQQFSDWAQLKRQAGGKEYNWDWLEGRYSLEKIKKLMTGNRPLTRVGNLRRVYESYVFQLGITPEEEMKLRSNLATASFYCAKHKVTPDETIQIYLRKLKLQKDSLDFKLKKQLVVATYAVAMNKGESTLKEVIGEYAEVLGDKVPESLQKQWLIATYNVAMNKGEGSLKEVIGEYAKVLGEDVPDELRKQWLIATYTVAMNKGENSLKQILKKLNQEKVLSVITKEQMGFILILTSYWIQYPGKEVESVVKDFIQSWKEAENKTELLQELKNMAYRRIARNIDEVDMNGLFATGEETPSLTANLFSEKNSWLNWLVRIPLAGAIVPHEVGHWLEAKYSNRIAEEPVTWKSFFSKMPWETRGPPALAGLLVNLILAAGSWFGLSSLESSFAVALFTYFFVSNAIIIVLEPIFSLYNSNGDTANAFQKNSGGARQWSVHKNLRLLFSFLILLSVADIAYSQEIDKQTFLKSSLNYFSSAWIFLGGIFGIAIFMIYRKFVTVKKSIHFDYKGDRLPKKIRESMETHIRKNNLYKEVKNVRVERKSKKVLLVFSGETIEDIQVNFENVTKSSPFSLDELDASYSRKKAYSKREFLKKAGFVFAGMMLGGLTSQLFTSEEVRKNEVLSSKENTFEIKRVNGFFVNHLTSKDFLNLKDDLDLIFEEARKTKSKVVFIEEAFADTFENYRLMYPDILSFTKDELFGLNPDQEKVNIYKSKIKDFYARLNLHDFDSLKRFIRQRGSEFTKSIFSYLDSNGDLLKEVSNEIELIGLDVMVESAYDYEAHRYQLGIARQSIGINGDVNEALLYLRSSIVYYCRSVVRRDLALSEKLKEITNRYQNDYVVFVRGANHALNGVLNNELGKDLKEKIIVDEHRYSWRIIFERAKSIYESHSEVEKDEYREILIKCLAHNMYEFFVSAENVREIHWDLLLSEADQLINSLTENKARELLERIPEFVNKAKLEKKKMHIFLLEWLRENAERKCTESLLANLFSGKTEWLNWLFRIPLAGAILPHELGHWLEAKVSGRVAEKPVTWKSFFSGMPWETRGPPALAGLTVNLLLGLSSFWAFSHFNSLLAVSFFSYLFVSNLILLVVEPLLSIYRSEGDTASAFKDTVRSFVNPVVIFAVIFALLFGAIKAVMGMEPAPKKGEPVQKSHSIKKKMLGLFLLLLAFPIGCTVPTPAPRRRLPPIGDQIALYPPKPKTEERTPQKLREEVLFSLGRVIKHIEEFGWLDRFSERRELIELLKAFAANPKIEVSDDSRWLMSYQPETEKLFVHRSLFWDMSSVQREGAILHELARQLPSQMRRYRFIKPWFDELFDADEDVLEDGKEGNALRAKVKRTMALWTRNESELVELEIDYYRPYAGWRGFPLASYLSNIAEASRNQHIQTSVRMVSGVVKPDQKINYLRLRVQLALGFPFFNQTDGKPTIHDVAKLEGIDIHSEREMVDWIESFVGDPKLYLIQRGETPPQPRTPDKEGDEPTEEDYKKWLGKMKELDKKEEEDFPMPDDKVRSPASGWSWTALNYLFYPLNWIEERVHYFVAREWYGVSADKPVVSLREAYTRVPVLTGHPLDWKTAKIALAAPLFWFTGIFLGSVIGVDPIGVFAEVTFLIPFAIGLIIGIPSLIMFVLHGYYYKTPGSDLYRFFYYYQEEHLKDWGFEYPPNNKMMPSVEWQERAKELSLLQEFLIVLLQKMDGPEFQIFEDVGLVYPTEGTYREIHPRQFYKDVVALGIESDLVALLKRIKLWMVPEEMRKHFSQLKEVVLVNEKEIKEWKLIVSTFDTMMNEVRELKAFETGLGHLIQVKKNMEGKWMHSTGDLQVKFVLQARGMSLENWRNIEVREAAVMIRHRFAIPYLFNFIFMSSKDLSYFANMLRGIFQPQIKTKQKSELDEKLDEYQAQNLFDTAV